MNFDDPKRIAGEHYEAGSLPAIFDNDFFWKMPHETRRRLFMIFSFRKYWASRKLKTRNNLSVTSHNLKENLKTKTLFIHIPKAAGISVVTSLYGCKTGDHRKIKDYLLTYSNNEFQSLYTFTFVRDPRDRAYSAYNFLSKGGKNQFDAEFRDKVIKKYKNFDDFVINWLSVDENFKRALHFKPQNEFLVGLNRPIDFIGRYENLQEDYDKLRSNLGFGEPLKSLNITEKDHSEVISNHCSNRSINLLGEIYKKDIEIFSYA